MSIVGYPHQHKSGLPVACNAIYDILHTRGGHFPYWGHIPHQHSLKYSSPIGEVVNYAEKYAFTVDLSHFHPDEIRVSVSGYDLTIEGKHDEKEDGHGTVQRSFIRKYTLPEDVNLKSVRSFLNKNGHLTVEAPKKSADLTQPRAIAITMVD